MSEHKRKSSDKQQHDNKKYKSASQHGHALDSLARSLDRAKANAFIAVMHSLIDVVEAAHESQEEKPSARRDEPANTSTPAAAAATSSSGSTNRTRHVWTQKEHKLGLKMREEKKSWKEVGKRFGVSPNSARRHFLEMDPKDKGTTKAGKKSTKTRGKPAAAASDDHEDSPSSASGSGSDSSSDSEDEQDNVSSGANKQEEKTGNKTSKAKETASDADEDDEKPKNKEGEDEDAKAGSEDEQ